MPVTTYVAYQKVTSPPYRPDAGGYHGIRTKYTFTTMLNMTTTSHARNSDRGASIFLRRYRTM